MFLLGKKKKKSLRKSSSDLLEVRRAPRVAGGEEEGPWRRAAGPEGRPHE